MTTDVYTCVPATHRMSPRMRTAQRADAVSFFFLVAFVIVAGVAIVDQCPPRALDDAQIQRVQ